MQELADNRLIVGLSVPARSFAAAFLAFGIVKEASEKRSRKNREDYFKQLCNLGQERPLVFRYNNRIHQGYFDGVCRYHGEEAIRVKDRVDSRVKYIFIKRRIHEIALLEENDATEQGGPAGGIIEPVSQFAENILEDLGLEHHAQTRFDCLLIGRVNWLKYEIVETELVLIKGDEKFKGSLQDILRVRRFLGNLWGFRTEAFSSVRCNFGNVEPADYPGIVLFDGCDSFDKWQGAFKKASLIALFDRTQREFKESVFQFNGYHNRVPGDDSDHLSELATPVPPGIDLCIHKEKVE